MNCLCGDMKWSHGLILVYSTSVPRMKPWFHFIWIQRELAIYILDIFYHCPFITVTFTLTLSLSLYRLLGVCADKDPVYIVMEFMPGGALLDYLRKKGCQQTKKKLCSMCVDVSRVSGGSEWWE